MEVLIENTGQKERKGGKLEDTSIDPYYINKAIGKGIYQLRNRSGKVLKRKINIARLKPYRKRKEAESVIEKCCIEKNNSNEGSEILKTNKKQVKG